MSGQLPNPTPQGTEIAFDLKPVPEIHGLPEKRPEADRHLRRDGALAMHDLVDRPWRHPDGAGHRVLRDVHGLEVVFEQDFAGSDRGIHECNV